MMQKMREVRSKLKQLGFTPRPGRKSHEVWTHSSQPSRTVVLYGANGVDAKPFQVSKVRKFRRGLMVYER